MRAQSIGAYHVMVAGLCFDPVRILDDYLNHTEILHKLVKPYLPIFSFRNLEELSFCTRNATAKLAVSKPKHRAFACSQWVKPMHQPILMPCLVYHLQSYKSPFCRPKVSLITKPDFEGNNESQITIAIKLSLFLVGI